MVKNNKISRRSQANKKNVKIVLGRKRQIPRSVVSVPAAYASRASAHSAISRKNGKVTLRAREIFPITGNFMIPCTPSKWSSTRTSVIASTYSAFRPSYFRLTWIPAVGTNTSGTVTVGTVFDGARADNSLSETSLLASNGGFQTQLYHEAFKRVELGTNLRSNNFPLFETNMDDIPFWVIVKPSVTGVVGQLGSLQIEATFALKNPIYNLVSPTSGSSTASITKESEDDVTRTYLNVPVGNFVGNFNVGQDFNFVSYEPLLNTSSQIVSNTLMPFQGKYSGSSGSVMKFLIDSAYNAVSSAFVSVVGRSTNFI